MTVSGNLEFNNSTVLSSLVIITLSFIIFLCFKENQTATWPLVSLLSFWKFLQNLWSTTFLSIVRRLIASEEYKKSAEVSELDDLLMLAALIDNESNITGLVSDLGESGVCERIVSILKKHGTSDVKIAEYGLKVLRFLTNSSDTNVAKVGKAGEGGGVCTVVTEVFFLILNSFGFGLSKFCVKILAQNKKETKNY